MNKNRVHIPYFLSSCSFHASRSFVMKEKRSKEHCFLCQKPFSLHYHGVKTIPKEERIILFNHWKKNTHKVSDRERVCCDHFTKHDDCLFRFKPANFPGLKQFEVIFKISQRFLLNYFM